MANAVETLGLAVGIEGFRQFLRRMGLMDDAIDDQEQSWGGLSGVASKAGGVLKGVATVGLAAVAAGAAAAIAGIGALTIAITKLTLDAAALEGTRKTFDTLWESIGETGPSALEKLRIATKGMVTDADLMQASNKFVSMGLAETSDEAAKLAELAVQLGVAMGEDAGASMENFALLLANQSIPRLDSFGISSGVVRERINELMESTEGLTREQAFMQAVLEQGEVTLGRVGDQSENITGKMAQMRASFENVKLQIGQAFLPVLEALIDVANELWAQVGPQVIAWAQELSAWLGENVPIAVAAAQQWIKTQLIPALTEAWSFIQTNVIPAIEDLSAWLKEFLPVAIEVARRFIQDIFLPAWQVFISYVTRFVIPIFQAVWSWLSEVLPPALATLAEFWQNVLLPAIQAVWGFISDNLIPLWDALINLWLAELKIVLTVIAGIWKNVLQPAIKLVWEWLKDKLIPILQPAITLFNNLKDAVGGVAGIFDIVIGNISRMTNALSNVSLPDWMTPGSPPPLFHALKDIASAMQAVSAEALQLVPAMASQAVGARGAAIGAAGVVNNVQDVRHFNLTTQSINRPGGLRQEFQAMEMASR